MGKICWINGQPYSVGLPTGGVAEKDPNNQWDEIISFLGEDCGDIFHWEKICSWCQNGVDFGGARRVVRGDYSARCWGYYSDLDARPFIGFRPVFIPLTADTLEPDPSLLEEIPDGERIALASLYMDKKAVDLSKEEGLNHHYYKSGKITLGDRDINKNNWLYVIKHKNLLWADRNILINISWDELQRQGYAD